MGFCVTRFWPESLSLACFVNCGHSLIVVCDINTETDSGTSVSKQHEPSLYSSCLGVTLMFCMCIRLRVCERGEIIVFSSLVFIGEVVCPLDVNPWMLVSKRCGQMISVKKGQTVLCSLFLLDDSSLLSYILFLCWK